MKTFTKQILITSLFIFSFFYSSAQNDCPIDDPLMIFDGFIDGDCCQIINTQTNIYYDVESVESGFEEDMYCGVCNIDSNAYKVLGFVHPGGTWAGDVDYCGYSMLADIIN